MNAGQWREFSWDWGDQQAHDPPQKRATIELKKSVCMCVLEAWRVQNEQGIREGEMTPSYLWCCEV